MRKQASSESNLEVTLGLLRAVSNDSELTQRSAAQELGIALGLVNTYLKRCVTKGFVKVKQAPNNRYAYYLTPKGFAEKSRLTAEFLSQSLNLFRQAQNDYTTLLNQCDQRGWQRIALCGASDLAEILLLYAREHRVQIIAVIDADWPDEEFAGIPVFRSSDAVPGSVDAYVITELRQPQAHMISLSKSVPRAASWRRDSSNWPWHRMRRRRREALVRCSLPTQWRAQSVVPSPSAGV